MLLANKHNNYIFEIKTSKDKFKELISNIEKTTVNDEFMKECSNIFKELRSE